jgi:hypothetical protein
MVERTALGAMHRRNEPARMDNPGSVDAGVSCCGLMLGGFAVST